MCKMLAAGIVLAFGLGASALEIPVIVQEPAGIARHAEPVSGGVPLPAGAFKPGDGAKFALFDGDRPVPVQVTELVVDHRGDLRWLLLDYQLDLKANETRTLTLKGGKPPRAAPIARQVPQGVRVDTGKLSFVVSRSKPFGLVEDVTVDGKAVVAGGEIAYTDALTGKRHTAAAPDAVKLVYNGPLRTTIEVRGRFAGDEAKLSYATYITAWAGRTDLLVHHSLINSRSDRMYFVKLGGATITLKPVRAAEGSTGPGWIRAGSVWVADRLVKDPPRLLSVGAQGSIVLNSAPTRGELKGPDAAFRSRVVVGDHRWIFDCSHHRSEYRIDFAATGDAAALAAKAKAAAARVWGFAPGRWHSQCQVLGVGRFGTLADEKACHRAWGWQASVREPDHRGDPLRFVAWEDNHFESEADSVEGLLLMFLRTRKRGFFDEAEAWARYHTDLQAWRTEGWAWTEGGIWWPSSRAFAGARKRRKGPNRPFVRSPGRNAPADDRSLWNTAWAKGCYCHHYGAGLVDWFCLTGDRNALDAVIDDCEMKLNEFTHHRKFVPGTSGLASTRGFGRGFFVAVRTWMVAPGNEAVVKLVRLCRDTFVKLPEQYLDPRGVYAPVAGKYPDRYLPDGVKAYMQQQGIQAARDGSLTDAQGRSWKWRNIGGTWMLAYIQDAVDLLAEQTGDEDLMDYSIATGHFAAHFMLSPVARQTWYYTALDIPVRGQIWDPWRYDGLARNADGEGPRHSGWYTRFLPDACARAYSWTGEPALMESARRFWSYGNRRRYRTTHLSKTHNYAMHRPPKDDSTLSTARLFYHGAHPRADTQPPETVSDLAVKLLGGGKAEIRFTAPADADGKLARYQVKCSDRTILDYDAYLAAFAKWEDKKVCNWWRAANLTGEPAPKRPGSIETFTVTGVPEGAKYFAIRSFDDSNNRSPVSNVAEASQ
jgi:hypothetical protein